MTQLAISVVEKDGRAAERLVPVERVLLAGYTGRDRARVLEHVRELQQLGVAPPPRVPMVYEVAPSLVTVEPRIVVNNTATSGEVELVVIPAGDGLLVGVGSDHTDRAREAIDVAESKTLCPKVVSREVWRYEDLKDHWDRIEIRAWTTDDGGRRLYQEGRLDAFMKVEDLLAEVRQSGHDALDGRLIFGGTIPTTGGFVYGRRFEAELRDPVLGRSLHCGYDVEARTAAGTA